MISSMLFGNRRRRVITIGVCVVAFSLSFIGALVVGIKRSPASAEKARKVPVLGAIASSLAESLYGVAPTGEGKPVEDVKTLREMRPLSAEEITSLIHSLKQQRDYYTERLGEAEREERRLTLYREELATERQQIEALRDKVVAQWEEINKTRKSIDHDLTELKSVEAKNLKQLATQYESMKPDLAAPIIMKIDEPTAAKILYLMRERAAGKILEKLDQDAAKRLTERMVLIKRTG